MQTALPSAKISGSGLLGYVSWFAEEHGVEQLYAMTALVAEPYRDQIDCDSPTLGLSPNQWYEANLAHALLDVLTRGLNADEQTEVARRASAHSVDVAIRGLFKLAFQLAGTPERYAKYIQRFWNQLHDTGVRSIEIVNPGIAISQIDDWRGHHPFLCELTTETMAALFRQMGCVDVEVTRVECISHGDVRCRTVLRYR